jgi:hypothetical protein
MKTNNKKLSTKKSETQVDYEIKRPSDGAIGAIGQLGGTRHIIITPT